MFQISLKLTEATSIDKEQEGKCTKCSNVHMHGKPSKAKTACTL